MKKTKKQLPLMAEAYQRLLLIQIVGVLTATLGGTIDAIIIGQFLGMDAMASFGFGRPLMLFMSALAGVFSAGAQTLCGKLMGRGNTKGMNSAFVTATTGLFVLGAAMTVVCYALATPLAQLFGASSELLGMTADYIRGYSLGIIPIIMMSTLTAFIQLDGQSMLAFNGILVMSGVNIALDFVNALWLHWGMFGMALATSVSYFVAVGMQLRHFGSSKTSFTFNIKEFEKGNLLTMVSNGMPSCVGRVCTMILALVLNRVLIANAGSDGVAALSIQNSIGSVVGSITIGVGMTTLLTSSVSAGEEDRDSLIGLMKYIVASTFKSVGIVAIVTIVLARPLAALLGASDEVALKTATNALIFYAISLPFKGVVAAFKNYFQGMGRILTTNVICVLDNMLVTAALAVVLAPGMGANGVWLATMLSGIGMLVGLVVWAWLSTGKAPNKMEVLMQLPDNFGPEANDYMDFAVKSIDDVMSVSTTVQSFCDRFDIDARRRMLLSLCVEEMAGNVVQHGFNDGKQHLLNIRVLRKGENIIVKMRDDCKSFNPKQQDLLFHPEDPTSHIGIRMIAKMAKDMEYQSTLKMNVLTIVV